MQNSLKHGLGEGTAANQKKNEDLGGAKQGVFAGYATNKCS